MARIIDVRLDPDSESALALLRSRGRTDSEAVCEALCAMADRQRTRAALRVEAEALAADPADRAEAAEVLALIRDLAPRGHG